VTHGTGRLVVGVDTEEAASTAVTWAMDRARRTGESLALVTATAFAIPPAGTLEALEATHQRVVDVLGDERVEQQMITEAMSIPEALIEEADGDPLVVGHHRTRPLRSALRGWLPLDIVLEADGPVFVVPDDVRPGHGEQIVVGVEQDGSSRDAISFAARQAEILKLPLTLLLAERTSRLGSALDMEFLLSEVRRTHPRIEVRSTLVQGPAVAALLAHSRDADIVVLGRHHATPVEEVLTGATGHELMKKSRATICIVPAPGPAE
jgi:nucleotide-binding universal stress UspA family protein